MLVRSWSVLFCLVAFTGLALAFRRRQHFNDRRSEYEEKRREYADKDNRNEKKTGQADERTDTASNKVSDSAVAQSIALPNVAVQSVQDNSAGALASFAELLEYSKPQAAEPPKIKTYVITKKVPVPYPVQYETRVPYPIKVPIRRPYAVYVPKPYYYEVPKPMPYTIKVPVPQPYHVEKHIPYPFKVPIDKPVPYHIAKPYPVFVEKKVPVPVEKQVPVPINIPVERPVPVQIPVEKPVAVAVEKPVLYPVKIQDDSSLSLSIEKPENHVEGTTTYEVNVKDVLPQSVTAEQLKLSSENHEFSTPLKTSIDFIPSPYDTFTSSLSTEGKQQFISFIPDGNQNNPFRTTKQGYSFEPLTVSNSQDGTKWTQFNSTDWIPRYVTSFEAKPNVPEALKLVSIQKENELKHSETVSKPIQQDPKGDDITAFQNGHIYNFVPIHQKLTTQKFQDVSLPFQIYQQSSQKPIDGNYQFYNVHPVHGSKASSSVTAVSFQKFEAEPKSSVEPPTQWVQVQDHIPQGTYQRELVSQQKNDNPPQQSTPQENQLPAHNTVSGQEYGQFNNFQKPPTQEQLQAKPNFISPSIYSSNQLSNNLQQNQGAQQQQQHQNEPALNQFSNQNFPQLQQYQQQVNTQSQQQQQYVPEPQSVSNFQNHGNFQRYQPFNQETQSNSNNYQQQHFQQQQQQPDVPLPHTAPPQQFHQQTLFQHQGMPPVNHFQNTFEQKQQFGENDIKMFLGHGTNGVRRRHRQPTNQQVQQNEELLRASPEPIATTEVATSVPISTEQPTRGRKTRRRNRKRNNNPETTTVNTNILQPSS